MAQIVTITNPLTGQPAQVDQLDHTAQEIDDAIDRAKAGGAIDKALKNNDPRQWGLGKDAKFISNTDLDTLFDSGFYTTGSGCTNVPVGTDQNWSGLFVMGGRACTQIYRPANGESSYFGSCKSLLIRIYKNGTGWQPWEWVNPPMFIGTEYRTTERYMGKPVYRKLIWGGPLPNSGYTGVSIASGCIIIQAVCHQTSAASASEVTPSTIGDVIPWNNNDDNGINMKAFKNYVNLWCKINRSSSNFVAYLWYIKDTD